MAGDGVSMPQSIAQMGTVAKAQAKGQPQAQQVTPFQEQKDKQEELKVQRVKETEATEHRRIDGDEDSRDKRRRRRQRRNRRLLAKNVADTAAGDEETTDLDNEEQVGCLLDLHA